MKKGASLVLVMGRDVYKRQVMFNRSSNGIESVSGDEIFPYAVMNPRSPVTISSVYVIPFISVRFYM